MGTRNLTCVVKDGEYKVAQYGQWDGYPSGNGKIILEFLKMIEMDYFSKQVDKLRFITEEEFEKILEEHTDNGNGSVTMGSDNDNYWKEHLQHLSRDMGATILRYVLETENPEPLRNEIEFAADSLFCEWAYVIDLDTKQFEVYEGFNQEPLSENERFYGFYDTDNDHRTTKYEPVKWKATYQFDNLPTEKEFLTELEPVEDDEE